jgi:hypothetical protein
MWHVIHISQILFSLAMCIMYPMWLADGYLDEWYPRIGAFIASYGGFIGGLLWYIDFLKRGKWL